MRRSLSLSTTNRNRNYTLTHRLAACGGLLALSAFLPSAVLAQVVNPPVPKWTGSVAAGLTLAKGNSDSLLVTLSGRGEKKWGMNEISLGADGAYGEDNGDESNELLSGFGQYNRLLSERWYAFGRVDALHDGMALVDYRFILSVGAGYYIVKKPNTKLSVEVGPGYVFERVADIDDQYATIRFGEKFEHKFNDRARMWQTLEVLPQIDDWENFIAKAEIGVESALTTGWSLRVVLQDTFDNRPAPGTENNDVKLIASLVWKF